MHEIQLVVRTRKGAVGELQIWAASGGSLPVVRCGGASQEEDGNHSGDGASSTAGLHRRTRAAA